MGKWYFDLQGKKQDLWVWRHMSEEGMLLEISRNTFSHYLDCEADARRYGYDGLPHFRPALFRNDAGGSGYAAAINAKRTTEAPTKAPE